MYILVYRHDDSFGIQYTILYTFRVIIVMKKRSVTSDGIQKKSETSGSPTRYASSVKRKNAESAKLQTTNVSFQYQKEDYEEMNPTDQPIYEETF